MENVKGGRANPIVKKGKKKQAKDELDRLKQAEKKRRRLEKALATSAAIRSELEKKKQKKIEEQQKLDEEAAAVAEAVALHVLLGEDTDDSHHFMTSNSGNYNSHGYSSNVDLFTGYQNFVKYSVDDGPMCASDAYGHEWNWINGESLPIHLDDTHAQYYAEASHWADISAGLIAAQAVSGLHITENSSDPRLSGHRSSAVVINKMLDKCNISNKVDFYREF